MIKDTLHKLGLKFCGFEAPQIIEDFCKSTHMIEDTYDLDKWQSYEKKTPNAFAGMYQFWCQKVDIAASHKNRK